MKNKVAFAVVILCFLNLIKISAQSFETYYEKSGFKKTASYDEVVRYCKLLSKSSKCTQFSFFGKSPQGRGLPLLIVKTPNPNKTKKDKPYVLIQACIHAGEPDGKEAGLMLIRDIITNKTLQHLIEKLNILFIPIFNVDGHERFGPFNRINQNGPDSTGWRTTAQNYNLNRDFMKADAPETQSWLKLFNRYKPVMVIDCHVTDGADYQYSLTYGLENQGNIPAPVTDWINKQYLPTLEKRMNQLNLPLIPYISFREWHDPRSGLESWISPPMLCNGYVALQNRPCLLIETHMLKDYKTRVNATYKMIENTLSIVNERIESLTASIKAADSIVMSSEFRKQEYALDYLPGKDSVMIDFLGFEYDSKKSDLSGGLWFSYSNIPTTFKIPYFNQQIANQKAKLPEAYIIPPEWIEVINKTKLHAVPMHILKKSVQIKVSLMKFKDVKWDARPYEGRQKVHSFTYDTVESFQTFPAGSVVIDMNQPAALLAAHLFEPNAPDSYIKWGFFNTIFQQKEYAESYVMEKLAREMLQQNSELKIAFEKKKQMDSSFASNPEEILNWFYAHSPWWDQKLNLYPVGKVFDHLELKKLLSQ